MRFIYCLLFIIVLNNCSSSYINSLSGTEYLCRFENSSNDIVDFSLKFFDKNVQITSWWIDRDYEDLVIDYHKNESDIYRSYTFNKDINIYRKLPNNKNDIYFKINKNTLIGKYVNQNITRSEIICSYDSKASYKMNLKIAIGKRNYDAYIKRKGF